MSVIFNQNLTFHLTPSTDNDITYIMSHPNSTSKFILHNGIFERELIQHCRDFLTKGMQDKVFLDIGAHIGTYSLNLARQFKHTYAFEAQKNTYYMLCGNVALNNLCDKITTKHCAVSSPENDNKMLTLNIVSEDGGGSSIKETNSRILTQEKVISKPLDYFGIENIGFIKMDVEGSELDVICGGLKTLEKSNYPPILFEAWSETWYEKEKQKLFSFLNSLGYKVEAIMYGNMFFAVKV